MSHWDGQRASVEDLTLETHLCVSERVSEKAEANLTSEKAEANLTSEMARALA